MKNILSIMIMALLLTSCTGASGGSGIPSGEGSYIPEEYIEDTGPEPDEVRPYEGAEDLDLDLEDRQLEELPAREEGLPSRELEDGILDNYDQEADFDNYQEDYPVYEEFSPGFDDFGNW